MDGQSTDLTGNETHEADECDFMRGCLIALPFSSLLWLTIVFVAGLVIGALTTP